MARIYEYQGKQVLKTVGVPIPRGEVATTSKQARKIAEEIGRPVAVKAQVWATGRFKAGGIQFAETPEEAERAADKILNSEIKGLSVEKVLVEERLDVEKEFYIGVIVDNSYKVKAPVLVFCTEGGVDVEEVASRNPERIAKMVVDYLRGVELSDACSLLSKVNLNSDEISKAVYGLYEAFKRYDARVAEINPLVLTKGGKVLAADCRITLDDNSIFRHP